VLVTELTVVSSVNRDDVHGMKNPTALITPDKGYYLHYLFLHGHKGFSLMSFVGLGISDLESENPLIRSSRPWIRIREAE